MKLQLTPQALRLRLSDEEIREFAATGELSHTLPLGEPGLAYTLRRLPPGLPAAAVRVCYEAAALIVEVPAALAQQLSEGRTVGLKSETLGTDGRPFRILVEKDLGPSH